MMRRRILSRFLLSRLLMLGLLGASAASANFGFQGAPTLPRIGPLEPAARGVLRVSFDCFLNTNVSCSDLEKSFFEADRLVTEARRGEADIAIKVREWNAPPNDEQYEIRFVGFGDLPPVNMPSHPLRIRASFSPQAKLLALRNSLLQGMSVYSRIEDYKTNPDGSLVLTYRADDGTAAPPKQSAVTPWSISASAFGNAGSNGAFTVQSNAGVGAAYDTPKWLAMLSANGSIQYVSENVGGTSLSAKAISAVSRLEVARSVSKHWSVLAMARETYDQVNNWESRAQADVGVEYELIPFLESNDNAFTVNYLIGANRENYIAPNIDGRMSANLATQALALYFVHHLQKTLDLTLVGGASSFVNDPTKFSVGASSSLTIYVTNDLTFNLGGNVGYKNDAINAAGNSDTGNPLYVLIGGASASEPLTFTVFMGVSYTWGNTLIRQKDMRWRQSGADLPLNF